MKKAKYLANFSKLLKKSRNVHAKTLEDGRIAVTDGTVMLLLTEPEYIEHVLPAAKRLPADMPTFSAEKLLAEANSERTLQRSPVMYDIGDRTLVLYGAKATEDESSAWAWFDEKLTACLPEDAYLASCGCFKPAHVYIWTGSQYTLIGVICPVRAEDAANDLAEKYLM